MGYEDRFIGNLDRRRERRETLSPSIAAAHEKAKKEVLSNPEYVIQETDFVDVYGAEQVQADRNKVAMLEREVFKGETETERNTKKIAETLETVVLMQSELSEWFGSGAQTLKSSKYDDYHNKVDMVTEWSSPTEGSRVLALAVDITFGMQTAEKKFAAIKKEINNDRLGSLRYFKDVNGDIMGTRNNVPRTVIGVSQPEVAKLAQLWLDNKQRQLGTHPIQALFADEIEAQLSLMLSYAKKQGKMKAIAAYTQALAAIRPLQAEKAKFRDSDLTQDPVAVRLREEAQRQFAS